jgi:phosphatidylinositol kinase/protein kinase (PI-3  family)
MSMAGYILGLGDRHMCNIMMKIRSAKLVHIDFGDCFERASNRKYLPEVVPFRLTRMMVRALGVGGIDGSFRWTFVNMGNMLRENRQVLEMVLLIFVHEPLVDPNLEGDESELDIEHGGAPVVPIVPRPISKVPTGSVVDTGRVYMTGTVGVMPSMQEMRARIRQKLTGAENGEETPLSVEEQTTWLIQSATNPYNLAKMYSGWCPFW